MSQKNYRREKENKFDNVKVRNSDIREKEHQLHNQHKFVCIPTLAGVAFLRIHKDIHDTATIAIDGTYICNTAKPISRLNWNFPVSTKYVPLKKLYKKSYFCCLIS